MGNDRSPWSQYNVWRHHLRCSKADNSELEKFKNIRYYTGISYLKYMQIFYDAQGKLTTQSKVGSTLN